jgi:hypothetical protein
MKAVLIAAGVAGMIALNTFFNSVQAAIPETAKASGSDLSGYKSDPLGLLNTNPIGGSQLTSTAKALVLADNSVVTSLVSVVKSPTANPQQINAIGNGIGAAVKAMRDSGTDEERKTAEAIAAEIGSSGLDTLIAGFDAGTKGLQTFAVGTGNEGPLLGGNVSGPITTASYTPSTSNAASPQSIYLANPVEIFSFTGATLNCQSSVSPARSC